MMTPTWLYRSAFSWCEAHTVLSEDECHEFADWFASTVLRAGLSESDWHYVSVRSYHIDWVSLPQCEECERRVSRVCAACAARINNENPEGDE